MQSMLESRLRCRVCGCAEVRTDEVVDTAVLALAECSRCEHRWTSAAPPRVSRSAPPMSVVRPVAALRPEVARAA